MRLSEAKVKGTKDTANQGTTKPAKLLSVAAQVGFDDHGTFEGSRTPEGKRFDPKTAATGAPKDAFEETKQPVSICMLQGNYEDDGINDSNNYDNDDSNNDSDDRDDNDHNHNHNCNHNKNNNNNNNK